MAQLIMAIYSLTVLTLLVGSRCIPLSHTLPAVEPIWPCFKTYQKLLPAHHTKLYMFDFLTYRKDTLIMTTTRVSASVYVVIRFCYLITVTLS